ncbi:MAG TPA: hypothetical protein VH475_09380 [Tepidisphaeraceae bacterium]|jgi:hypothetical protein
MPVADALTHLRAHPEFYLPGGRLEPSDFATRLAGDALALGATRTLAVHHHDWWAVAADTDWLVAIPQVAPRELFQRIVPFPQAGANSMRSEVLIAAFADDVVTWTNGVLEVLKGRSEGLESPRMIPNDGTWRRAVAFRFEPARLKATLIPAATSV